MTRSERPAGELSDWLNQKQNQALIETIARGILKKIQSGGHVLKGMAPDIEEVKQEIALILVQDETASKNLIQGGRTGLIRARRILYSRLIDLCRSKDGNEDIHKSTWHLFYRNVLSALGNSDRFAKTVTPLKTIFFSLTDQAPVTVATVEDFLTIPYPANLPANFERVNTAEVILALASHFWHAAADQANDPGVRFTANDFIVWVKRYVPLVRQVKSYSTGGGDKDEFNPLLDHPETPQRNTDTEKTLGLWSQNFVVRLDDTEKQVFFYRQCMGLAHKKISELMGKKASLSYQMQQATKKLKTFMRDLDLLAPEFLEEDEFKQDFEFFINQICIRLGCELDLDYP